MVALFALIILTVSRCFSAVDVAGSLRRADSHSMARARAGAKQAPDSPMPVAGGPVAVQIDWLIENGLLNNLQGAISDSCEARFKETVALSTAGARSTNVPQKAEDSFQCGQLIGRTCTSRAIFSEDKEWHKKRQPKTQLTIWDLYSEWEWCLPKACADTDDLRKIASFMRMRIGDLVKPETAPLAIQTSLLIDCQGSGGGYAYVDYNDKWTFKAFASTQALSSLLTLMIAALLAHAI